MKTVYLSELKELEGKYFETKKALEEAEAAVSEEAKKKQAAADRKKAAVEKVKAAIAHRVEVRAKAVEDRRSAYEEYLAKVDELDAKIAEANQAEREALEEFCKEYGYFHETVKIGETEYDYRYGVESSQNKPISSLEAFLNAFNRF